MSRVSASVRRHVHPFPARMAPEVALEKIDQLTCAGDTVLDPMCGSGTVVRIAGDSGRVAIGADLDPLAVLITRTACYPSSSVELEQRANDVVDEARRLRGGLPPWIKCDSETSAFVSYWFAQDQARNLSRLARVLRQRGRYDDPLRVALSRTIVTKEAGASLARDTSHSRPHRVRDESDYDVFSGFIASAKRVAELAKNRRQPKRRPRVRREDARSLGFVAENSVDLVVTSPPYLNAIDYLRGHRLSLIWMDWTIPELRRIRSSTVGAERGLSHASDELRALACRSNPRMAELAPRHENMVLRFTADMNRLCRSLARVVKPSGHLVFVVADSQLGGIPVDNTRICVAAAQRNGFVLTETSVRPLPAQHRYLPPPNRTSGTMSKRMKEEAVLTFIRESRDEPAAATENR